MNAMKAFVASCVVTSLVGCSSPTTQEDIAAAEQVCHFRGGMKTVERYEGGRTLIIRCKDGAYIDLKLRWVGTEP